MTEPSATALIFETTAAEECPGEFLGDSADIVYFISFAYSQRYGADHPLAKAAAVLKRRLGLNLAPLLTFGDARADSGDYERALEAIWQDAAPLAESARRVAEAIDQTPELRALTADFRELPDRLRELAEMADWAAQRGARVRLSYVI
ncbi:MAG: hypothetical protein A2W34_04725 [Chloroflexi bacterium RBG_16_64_32]|nr:MAG: hypothetical protein A2W34_04725 [Chloroflexi bacterium RBG_16_64_32]